MLSIKTYADHISMSRCSPSPALIDRNEIDLVEVMSGTLQGAESSCDTALLEDALQTFCYHFLVPVPRIARFFAARQLYSENEGRADSYRSLLQCPS